MAFTDRGAFLEQLSVQRSTIFSRDASGLKRKAAVQHVMDLYRLRISFLSQRSQFNSVQESLEHYTRWCHLLEPLFPPTYSDLDFDILWVSSQEAQRLRAVAVTLARQEARVKGEYQAEKPQHSGFPKEGLHAPKISEYVAKASDLFGNLSRKWLIREPWTQKNLLLYRKVSLARTDTDEYPTTGEVTTDNEQSHDPGEPGPHVK